MFLTTFINIPGHKETVMTVYPPVGILSMSSCLKLEGCKVNFIDADACRLNPEQVVNLLKNDPPQLIGISLNVSQVSHSVAYIEEIRKKFPSTPFVLGGPYVTGVQEDIFKDFPIVDYAVLNEGEYAIVDLVEYIKGEKRIEDVRNLIYKSGDKIAKNRIERILDLDSLPLPDYSLVLNNIKRYKAPYPSIASPSIAIMCTRGCPYKCTFCSSPSIWSRKVTFRSTDSVIDEILLLKKMFNVREIFFQDDTLNARPAWFFELCDKIIAHGLHKEIFFKCPFRLNKTILTEDILRKAKEANFWMIFYGVESGNQEMLDKINKNVKVDDIVRAFRLTRKAELSSYASFMIGNYGETKKTVHDSMRLLKKIMPDYGGFAIAAPFPGTELYRIAVEKKLLILNDFRRYQFGDCILRTEELNVEDIVSLAREANELLNRNRGSLKFRIISRKYLSSKVKQGFYEDELWQTWINRTMKHVSHILPKTGKANRVCLKILADYPDISKNPVVFKIWINRTGYTFKLDKSEWTEIKLPIQDNIDQKFVYIKWDVNRTWNPQKWGLNDDNRELGITVESIELEECSDFSSSNCSKHAAVEV